nr:MAG TPA: hypothetical protein [Caudoviricetes sp.]
MLRRLLGESQEPASAVVVSGGLVMVMWSRRLLLVSFRVCVVSRG